MKIEIEEQDLIKFYRNVNSILGQAHFTFGLFYMNDRIGAEKAIEKITTYSNEFDALCEKYSIDKLSKNAPSDI